MTSGLHPDHGKIMIREVKHRPRKARTSWRICHHNAFGKAEIMTCGRSPDHNDNINNNINNNNNNNKIMNKYKRTYLKLKV
jgi:hypothetical protein